jgi:hypothetical protein
MRVKAKFDAMVLAVVNSAIWIVEINESAKTLFTVLSIGFLCHRWWYWNKHKDDPKKPGTWNST